MPGCLSINERSQTALHAGFGNAGASSKKRSQVGVNKGRAVDSRQIGRRLKTRENGVGNLASRDGLLTIAGRNIAGPVADILHTQPVLHSEKNSGVSVLAFTHLP